MSNPINSRDIVPDEEVVTMQDAMHEMESEEQESIAVFGAGDENNCTYTLVSKLSFKEDLNFDQLIHLGVQTKSFFLVLCDPQVRFLWYLCLRIGLLIPQIVKQNKVVVIDSIKHHLHFP